MKHQLRTSKFPVAALLLITLLSLGPSLLSAQMPGSAFSPKTTEALAQARTVAVMNDTHQDAVSEGAIDALKAWGHFTVVDDPDTADITLRFDKSKDHAGQDSQKTDPNDGKTAYGYSMSFSSSIHMKAFLKDGETAFYTTKTDDSKKKAGISCVNDFRSAVNAARSH